MIVFVLVTVSRGSVGPAVSAAIAPHNVFGPGLGLAFLFSVNAFIGFEATVLFSEEARDPHRTIPRAVIIAICWIAGLLAVCSLAVSAALGPDHVQSVAVNRPSSLVLDAFTRSVGSGFADAANVLIVTSFLASLIGFHNMFARLVFSLGRAGVMPKALGITSGRGTPVRSAVVIAVAVAIPFFIVTALGADPILQTFSWSLALGTVGLLALLATTAAAIAAYFQRVGGEGIWRSRILPLVAFLGFVAVAVLSLTHYDDLLGGQGGAAKWLLVLVPMAAVAGVVVAKTRTTAPNFSADLG